MMMMMMMMMIQRFNAILLHDSFIDEETETGIPAYFSLCNRPNFCHLSGLYLPRVK